MIRAALYFYNCTDVSMNQVQVLKSSQAIAVVMYNVDGIVDMHKQLQLFYEHGQ